MRISLRRESNVEGDTVAWAKARGIVSFKLNLLGSTGWPDRVFLARGARIAFIEFKREDKEAAPERNQWVRHRTLRSLGFQVGVFNNVHEATSFLEATLLST